MTRLEAQEALRRFTQGLQPDLAGTSRLLERISASDEPEMLRDLLVEAGARALLDREAGQP